MHAAAQAAKRSCLPRLARRQVNSSPNLCACPNLLGGFRLLPLLFAICCCLACVFGVVRVRLGSGGVDTKFHRSSGLSAPPQPWPAPPLPLRWPEAVRWLLAEAVGTPNKYYGTMGRRGVWVVLPVSLLKSTQQGAAKKVPNWIG